VKNLWVRIPAVLALTLGLAACGEEKNTAAVPAKPGVLIITNNTGEVLSGMDITVGSEFDRWEGRNLFNGKTVKPGESVQIPLSVFPKNQPYNLMFISQENSYFVTEVDVRTAGTVVVGKDDLFLGNQGN